MSEANVHKVDIEQARAFLANHLGTEPMGVSRIGEGAWSRCFGFRYDGQDLVIRFGNYVSDFQKDKRAYAYTSPDLPIPEVRDIGPAFDGYYAVSTRVYGVPLESLSGAQWRAVVPSVVAAMEAMRTADLSSTSGFGGWEADGSASHHSWSNRLLSVSDDAPDRRIHGWRERLVASPQGGAAAATFAWGFDMLKQVVDDAVPRCLLHCDFINRNVLVSHNKISGVLDWGCSVYGDHLYELAWFEFWGSWFPQLTMQYLRSELERRWLEVGYVPENKKARLRACYLHIGLDHLAYNAYIEDWAALSATAERMRTLVPEQSA